MFGFVFGFYLFWFGLSVVIFHVIGCSRDFMVSGEVCESLRVEFGFIVVEEASSLAG